MEVKPLYRSIKDIPYKRTIDFRLAYPFIPLNRLTGGGKRGTLNIIASASDNGKSTLIMQFLSYFIKDGEKIFAIFGEHNLDETKAIMYRQVSFYNKDAWRYVNYEKNGRYTGISECFISEEDERKADDIYGDSLQVYDTTNPMHIDAIKAVFSEVRKLGIQTFVIDNMMQIEYRTANEFREQKDVAEELRKWAQENDATVYLIMHMKKASDKFFIRYTLDDIAGSSNIPNKANSVIFVYRTDKLDMNHKGYEPFKTLMETNNYDLEKCAAILEVAKVKNGRLGFIGLQYFDTTKTYKEAPKIREDYVPKPKQQSINAVMTLVPSDNLPF